MTTPIVVCAECGGRNPAHNEVCGLCNKPLNGPIEPGSYIKGIGDFFRAIAEDEGMYPEIARAPIGWAYSELIMAVERKFPGETRHQTALRYIREAEAHASAHGMAVTPTTPTP